MLILSSCPDILLHTVLQKHSNTFDIVYMRAYKTDPNSLNFIYNTSYLLILGLPFFLNIIFMSFLYLGKMFYAFLTLHCLCWSN